MVTCDVAEVGIETDNENDKKQQLKEYTNAEVEKHMDQMSHYMKGYSFQVYSEVQNTVSH